MNNYLLHHGIKGMHWGERRYQNYDGTLTPAGIERYYGNDKADAAERRGRLLNANKRTRSDSQINYFSSKFGVEAGRIARLNAKAFPGNVGKRTYNDVNDLAVSAYEIGDKSLIFMAEHTPELSRAVLKKVQQIEDNILKKSIKALADKNMKKYQSNGRAKVDKMLRSTK